MFYELSKSKTRYRTPVPSSTTTKSPAHSVAFWSDTYLSYFAPTYLVPMAENRMNLVIEPVDRTLIAKY